MRWFVRWLTSLLFIFWVLQTPLWAKDLYSVTVLPFTLHSAENIDYVRQGVSDMLASRMSANEKIRVVGKDALQAALQEYAGRELNSADVFIVGRKLQADFTVWGTITKIGNSLSIDAKLADISSSKETLTVSVLCQTMDEVIPKVNEIAQRINAQITGPAPAVSAMPRILGETVAVRSPVRPPAPQMSREAEIISSLRGGRKGTYTSSINPDFISAAQPVDSKSMWKSIQFPLDFKGIDIGDVNGDGLNETVMIDQNTVHIYQKKGNDFNLVQKFSYPSHNNFVALDVADINRNGIKEIIVSSYSGSIVTSFVLEFVNGKFETIASDLPWFMRVIETTPGSPLLMGQRLSPGKDPLETPIYEIVWRDRAYQEGQRMKIPEGLSVYGLTLDRLTPGGSEMILALNVDDYLFVLDQTTKPLTEVLTFGGNSAFHWKSEEHFGGSNTTIEPINPSVSVGRVDTPMPRNINLRILSYDTNKDGKREFIVVKNIPSAGRLLANVRLFNSAEVYNLEWDGMGMVENWRTKKINGYIADYQFKDIDNDGENEIVLALVITGGGFSRGRSVILAYELKKD